MAIAMSVRVDDGRRDDARTDVGFSSATHGSYLISRHNLRKITATNYRLPYRTVLYGGLPPKVFMHPSKLHLYRKSVTNPWSV